MKLRLNKLRAFMLIVLVFASPVLLFVTVTGAGLNPDLSIVVRVFISILFLFAFGFVWYLLFTRICAVEANDNGIVALNYITQKQTQISISEIDKVVPSFWNNTFDLINKKGEKLIRLDQDSYTNIKEFISMIDNNVANKT